MAAPVVAPGPLSMTLLARIVVTVSLVAVCTPAAAFDQSSAPASLDEAGGRWVALQSIAGKIFGFENDKPVDQTSALRLDRVVVGVDGPAQTVLDARWLVGPGIQPPLEAPRARIGDAFDRFVVYGTAGGAFASAEFARSQPSQIGWTVGGGIEARLFAGVSAKLEYLYVDLDRKTIDTDGDVGIAPAGGQFRAGLNYRF